MPPGWIPHGGLKFSVALERLWARSRTPGAPQMGAGAGVKAADGWGSPPQFRDRPACGKQQFSGLESTFFPLTAPKVASPLCQRSWKCLWSGRRSRWGDLHRRGCEAIREGAQHPRGEHSTGQPPRRTGEPNACAQPVPPPPRSQPRPRCPRRDRPGRAPGRHRRGQQPGPAAPPAPVFDVAHLRGP